MNPSESPIEIRQPEPHELAAVRTLRQEELNGDQPLPAPVEPTPADLDPASLHMAAFQDGEVVSAVRVDPLPEPPGTYHASRMVTRDSHRGQGIGTRVLAAAERAAAYQGANRITLNSRPTAKDFYLKSGYRPQPDATVQPGEDIPMEKNVAAAESDQKGVD